jgi:hypothetical protein
MEFLSKALSGAAPGVQVKCTFNLFVDISQAWDFCSVSGEIFTFLKIPFVLFLSNLCQKLAHLSWTNYKYWSKLMNNLRCSLVIDIIHETQDNGTHLSRLIKKSDKYFSNIWEMTRNTWASIYMWHCYKDIPVEKAGLEITCRNRRTGEM